MLMLIIAIDLQKGNAPVQYIAGHLSKIHGLDWHPTEENVLATSSQDCSVKVSSTHRIFYHSGHTIMGMTGG